MECLMVDIDPNLMQTFLEESEENLAIAEKHLLDLENNNDFNLEIIGAIFRAIHSFKGGSSFFNLTSLVNLLHVVESLLSNLQNSVFSPTKEMFKAVIEALDLAKNMLYSEDYGESTDITGIVGRVTQLNASALNKNSGLHLFDDDEGENPEEKPTETLESKQSVNEEPKKEESIDPPVTESKPVQQAPASSRPQEAKTSTQSSKKKKDKKPRKSQSNSSSTVRVKTSLIDNILDQVGEVILVRNQLAKKYPAEDIVSALSQRISKLHNTILETRMQSVSTLFEKFNRVVRDLSLQLDKNIALNIDAGDVELDRTILESFSDPMTHLVRNAADHGLESTSERVGLGKSPQGNLYLRAYQRGGKVEIEVEDDGAGVNIDSVKRKALEKGLITDSQAEDMSDLAAINLIMLPGFSTRDQASELSGRGVGMDVVKSSIEEAGGILKIYSREGKGSKFTASFPLTLAIATALIVEAGDQRFAIPEILVEEISSVRWSARETVLKMSDDKLYFHHRGELIPAVHLENILNLDGHSESQDEKFMFKNIVLCKQNNQPFCIIVDKILNIEDIAVKGMPLLISSCEVFAGLTVLENGEVSMLLDIPKIGDLIIKDTAIGLSEEDDDGRFKESVGESRKEQVIIFTNAEAEFFGIHIDFISEITSIKSSEVEKVGEAEFFKLHGKHIPLIRVEDYLPVAKPVDRNNLLIFVSSTEFPIGVIATKAVKVRNVGDELNSNLADNNGILSTVIDDDHMVTILDVYTLFRRRAPDHFQSFAKTGDEKKILLVEDTAFFVILISQYLKEAGYQVEHARDGIEALEKIQNSSQLYDAIVSDVIMPGMDGLELMERVRRNKKEEIQRIPCIAVTSVSDEMHLNKIRESGFDHCVLKNEKMLLLSILNKVLSGGDDEPLELKIVS